MKLWTNIAVSTLVFFAIQMGVWGLLFAEWAVRIVLGVLCLGAVPPMTSYQRGLLDVFQFLTYPIRLLQPEGPFGTDGFSTVLCLGINSAIWGVGLGTLFSLFWRLLPKAGGTEVVIEKKDQPGKAGDESGAANGGVGDRDGTRQGKTINNR
jgi:hypothetical protein